MSVAILAIGVMGIILCAVLSNSHPGLSIILLYVIIILAFAISSSLEGGDIEDEDKYLDNDNGHKFDPYDDKDDYIG